METVEKTNEVDKVVEKKEIDITYVSLTRILTGLTDLSKLDISDFDINLNIMRLIKKLSPLESAYNKTRKGCMDEHIAINESNGTYKVDGSQMYVYKSEKDRVDYFTKITELNNKKVDGITFTIKASELKKLKKINANILININEFVVDDLE
jgi:hypothetical protein